MTTIHARSDIHGAPGFLPIPPAIHQQGASTRFHIGWIGFFETVVERLENGARRLLAGARSAFSGKPTSNVRGSRGRFESSGLSRVPPIIRRSVLAVSLPRPVLRRAVWFNRALLSDQLLPVVDHIFRRRLAGGHYWYDYVSGEWGIEGRGRSGKIRHGLELGGPLPPDASNGKTGIFVNGREITSWESIRLRWATSMGAGRYRIDQNGNFGPENGPAIGNIRSLATNKTPLAERPAGF